MDLFRIVGRIAIEGADEARNELTDTENQAEQSSSKMGTAFSKIGDAATKVGKLIVKGLAAGATGISFLTKSAIDAYADYEQLVGGVETLFKDSSDKVVEYANNAYKTAGLSANDYMETVTSFSASLLQGLGGDTDAAAEVANQAIVDMSDNANKMGTSMEMIQNAYQGFAKQNYTMLDNLKLGYGGTATEMARLINDSGVLGDSMTVTADTVNSVSFDKMIEAIHVIQTEMGITGTTSLEASTTIQGSMSSLKASWTNVLVGLADDTQDFGALLDTLSENFVTVVGNVLPRVQTVFNAIPKLIEGLLPQVPGLVQSILPGLLEGAIALMNGLVGVLPQLIQIIVDNLPLFIDGFMQIFVGLVASLSQIIQPLIVALPNIIIEIVNGLLENLPALIEGCVQLIVGLVAAMPDILVALIEYIPKLIELLVVALWESLPTLIDGVMQMVDSLVQGIGEVLEALLELIGIDMDSVSEIWNNAWTAISDFFTGIWQGISDFFSGIWEGIKNIVQFALLFIEELFNAWIEIITAPWKFIWENFGDTITSAWETIKEVVSNGLNAISEFITNILNGIKEFWDSIWQAISDFLTPIITAIHDFISEKFNAVKDKITNIFNSVSNFISNIWNTIKNFISNTINGIKTNVSNVFNAIKEKIETPLNNAKTTVSNIFNNIKDGIKQKIESARDTVKNAIEKIKSFFNFSWSLPKLKMPHVSISGSFSLVPPSVPHFSVDWYAKGGILTEPTIFGFNPETGRTQVGGEAGDEAVAPIDLLLGYVRTAVAEQNAGLADSIDNLIAMLAEYLPQILNKNSQLVLDTGVLVGHTASAMNEELGNIYDRNGRGG